MIELHSVTFKYDSHNPIFENFSWQVHQGERWAVIGPSGCGKSTLLYLMAGLIPPSNGQVIVDGQILKRPRPNTGLIIQEYGLLPWATVHQNVSLGLKVRGFYGPDGTHAPVHPVAQPGNIDAWLTRLGLADLANRYPSQLSGGQRQRTALARTLVLHPNLLLMDEPFSSLDAPTREGLQTLAIDLCQEQKITLVVVTHAIEEAAIMGEKILVLSRPPNSAPVEIANPGARHKGFHLSPEYMDVCSKLRAMLESI
jgi:ABC-type nitrate/sulfonate/bicarbonate transport system ATPase subunit